MLSRTGTGTRRINLRKKTDFDFRIREISANFRFEETKKTDCWIWRVFNNDAKLSLVRTGLFPFGILGLEGAQFLSLCDDRIARHFYFFFWCDFHFKKFERTFSQFFKYFGTHSVHHLLIGVFSYHLRNMGFNISLILAKVSFYSSCSRSHTHIYKTTHFNLREYFFLLLNFWSFFL